MTSLITSTIRYAGAAEAIDELHAAAVAARDAAYACTDAAELAELCRAWDAAERELSEAVGDLLRYTIDGDTGVVPVAWTHRVGQIARLAGVTEAQVEDALSGATVMLYSETEIRMINSRTNARLARWIADVYGYVLA